MSGTRLAPTMGLGLAGLGGILALAVIGVTLFLASGTPYVDTTSAWTFTPSTLLAPLRSYLFRNAVANTAWLALGATALVLPLAWLWARMGIPRHARALHLLPLLLPGAIAGLLWRPLLEPWLVLAQAEVALVCTGLVIVWQALPASALILTLARRAWFLAALPPLWLALGDAGLVITLTRGEPFNAAHTWASWALSNWWVMRGWGLAAAMSLGLAAVTGLAVAAIVTLSVAKGPPTPMSRVPVRGAWLLTLAWVGAPVVPVLWDVAGSPMTAVTGWLGAGGVVWLATWLALVGSSAGLSVFGMRTQAGAPLTRRGVTGTAAVTAALWLLWPFALFIVSSRLPWTASPWLLVVPLTGVTLSLLRLVPSGRSPWAALGVSALLLSQAFALELALGFTPGQALPTLGTVMTLGEGEPAARGLALLVHAGLALCSAWMLTRSLFVGLESQTHENPILQRHGHPLSGAQRPPGQ